jgi:DNA-directed RNA polymerase subunit RPC12/RpoP
MVDTMTEQNNNPYVIWICPTCGNPENVPTDSESQGKTVTKELEVECEYCRIDGKLELEV